MRLAPRIALALALAPHTDLTSEGFVRPSPASVESNLATDSGKVRQFAFDGDPDTYFGASAKAPTDASDHLTLAFEAPVSLKSVSVATGRPAGEDTLGAGTLEVSADGSAFEEVARFGKDGSARAEFPGRPVRAIRIRPPADLGHPLVVREIAVDSDPKVETFAYPVEYEVESDDPKLKEWGTRRRRIGSASAGIRRWGSTSRATATAPARSSA